MRLTSILSEMWRNIGSGTTRAFIMMLITMIVATLLGGYEAASVIALENQAVTRIRSLADTKTIVAGGDLIDGTVCDRLSNVTHGPSSSGAMRAGDQITPLSTPGKDVSSYEVTSGMLRILTTNTDGAVDASGIWVSSQIAADFGLTTNSHLETDHGTVQVAGVFDWPNDGRDTRFAYAIIVPVSASARPFSECWAKQWPSSADTDSFLYSTVIVSGSGQNQAGVMAVNKGFDARYDAQTLYEQRMTRWTPWLGLMIGMLLGAISVRQRRLEYAGALHCGQTKGSMLLGICLETFIWSGFACASGGTLLAAYCVRAAQSDTGAVIITSLRTPIAVYTGCVIAALLYGLTIRESQLFRFFKNR